MDSLIPNRAAYSYEHTLVQGGRNGELISRIISSTPETITMVINWMDGGRSEHTSDPPSEEQVANDCCMEDVGSAQHEGEEGNLSR